MTPLKSCELELSRFFNKYFKYCASSDADDLKELLSVMCSACEKLEKVKSVNFGNNKRYRALKALRNFATHESELLNTSKAISVASVKMVHAEVQLISLLPVEVVDYAIRNLKSKQTIKYLKEVTINYGKYVDIYPALFNFTVDLYFEAVNHNLAIDGSGFKELENSINYEKLNGFPHYIGGKIIMLDGSDVNTFIETQAVSIENKNREVAEAPVGEDGLKSYVTGYEKMPFDEASVMKKEDKDYILNLLIDSGVVTLNGNKVSTTRPLNPIETVIVHEHLNKSASKLNT
ncbi:hypothetical protein J9102_004302 [Vibrio vulnificus]|uniref:hypothetical protein n=1 Tax=Vibrio TaxID=662 RepID=UPI0009F07E97|nr:MULTISPECIES: hypothetical protein [Vibrio]MCS0030539.1 hypothetical protein [Vibrio alginolyticus]EGR1876400.1 hypothetical protein [Vibrio parahaemolyticus]EHI9275068.1 hypothetical protein [Vibrio vulnificus]EHK5112008.1 hypothetical protein [Vibrio parahaemolyticus]EME0812653.1 hypothetical protein [Vibrio vulnificus]